MYENQSNPDSGGIQDRLYSAIDNAKDLGRTVMAQPAKYLTVAAVAATFSLSTPAMADQQKEAGIGETLGKAAIGLMYRVNEVKAAAKEAIYDLGAYVRATFDKVKNGNGQDPDWLPPGQGGENPGKGHKPPTDPF